MKTPGIITVRSSSTRLPGKCFLPFGEGSVLEHIIRRTAHYGMDPIVCTSVDPSDDAIEALAKRLNVKCFRGSLANKLRRWADCAHQFKLEGFHTVDADDPFFDGAEMIRSFELLKTGKWDVVTPTASSSAGSASVGYSLTTSLVARASEKLAPEADTEMMWYHLDKVPGLRKTVLPESDPRPAKLRLTLDYQEDYWLMESVRRIVGNLAARAEVDNLFFKNPDLHLVNWFRNEEWKAGQIAKKI